jgi:CBS domain-containing protein
MPFTLEELLPDDQRLRTVQMHDAVQQAINLMHQHGYSQLPVVDKNGQTSLEQVVTFDSILQAVRSFNTKPELLHVRDVARGVRVYPEDADLLATLDDIQRENFALIVDDKNVLTGIVTTADTTFFFREYAQDLMQIEGIESRMKEAITALYAGNDSGLESAIESVTDRAADIRKKIPAAIRGYLEKAGLTVPSTGDTEAVAEAEKRLALPKPGKAFDRLTFDEFAEVLLRHPNAPKLAQSNDVSELRGLLQQVRDARNKLAHFRGELSAEERRTIQFASEWLERNLPVPSIEPPAAPAAIVASSTDAPVPQEDEDESPKGSYAPLAAHLKSQAASVTALPLTFQEIERIQGKGLPRSAYEYRAWWINDPAKPQSAAWLNEGWRAVAVNMSERRLTFVRTNERVNAYIKFFGSLNAQLDAVPGFPSSHISPKGANWQVLAFLPWTARTQSASLFATFTRNKEMRIELYLDCGNRQQNEQRFNELFARKSEIEAIVGEPLKWERRETNLACRIAIYTKAQIQTDAQNPKLLDWATQKAIALYKAFGPEFSTMQQRR